MSEEFLYKFETYQIVGAAMEVHNQLGNGFLESVYQEALEIEMSEREIPYIAQSPIEINYKLKTLTRKFIADFFCYDDIIVEIKAISQILPEHEAQILNYLKATNVQLGLLINFGTQKLTYKRYLNT